MADHRGRAGRRLVRQVHRHRRGPAGLPGHRAAGADPVRRAETRATPRPRRRRCGRPGSRLDRGRNPERRGQRDRRTGRDLPRPAVDQPHRHHHVLGRRGPGQPAEHLLGADPADRSPGPASITVSGGSTTSARSRSSNPTTAIRCRSACGAAAPPAPRPRSGSARRTPPSAGRQLEHRRHRQRRPAADPPARATAARGRRSVRPRAAPGTYPRCRSSAVYRPGRSPRKAIRRWPCAIRCAVASCAPLLLATRTVGQASRRGGRSTKTTGRPRSISGCRKEWSRRQDMITRRVHRPGQQPVDQVLLAVRVGVGAHRQDQAALLRRPPVRPTD